METDSCQSSESSQSSNMSSSSTSGIGSCQDDGYGNGVCQSDVDSFESAMQQGSQSSHKASAKSESSQKGSEESELDNCPVKQAGISVDNYDLVGCGFDFGRYNDTVTGEKGYYADIECGFGWDQGADYTGGCAPNVEAQKGGYLTGEVKNYNVGTSYGGDTIVSINSGSSNGPISGHVAGGVGAYISDDDIEKTVEAIKDAPGDVKDGLSNTVDYSLQKAYDAIMSRIRL